MVFTTEEILEVARKLVWVEFERTTTELRSDGKNPWFCYILLSNIVI